MSTLERPDVRDGPNGDDPVRVYLANHDSQGHKLTGGVQLTVT